MKTTAFLLFFLCGSLSSPAGDGEKDLPRDSLVFSEMRIVHQKNDKSLTLSFKLSCSGGGVPLTPLDARGLAVVDSTGKKLGIRNVRVIPELSYENDSFHAPEGKAELSIQTNSLPSVQAEWIRISGNISIPMGHKVLKFPAQEIEFEEAPSIIRHPKTGNPIHLRISSAGQEANSPLFSVDIGSNSPVILHSITFQYPDGTPFHPKMIKIPVRQNEENEQSLRLIYLFRPNTRTLLVTLSYFDESGTTDIPVNFNIGFDGSASPLKKMNP